MTDVTPPPAPQTAVPADSAAVPAAPAAPPAETAPVRRKGRFPGVASLILALLAVVGDIAVFVIAIVGIASFASSFDPSTLDFSTGLTAFFGFAAIAFWGGIIVAGLALLLGIIGIVSNRGRIAAIFGTIISILVLLTHLSIALAIGNIGAIPTDLLPS